MRTSADIDIFGYVGKDPVAPMSNNQNFITFSVSVTTKWKDKSTNEEKQSTSWFECQNSNESVATLIKKYIKKGQAIHVKGTPKCDAYLDKEGKPKATFKVNIKEFRILNYAENTDSEPVKSSTSQASRVELDDDEIPF